MTAQEFKKKCEAVEGYTALGLLDDANNILEDLPSELKITKDVITLHMAILLKAGEYLKASYLAETLSMSEPDDVDRLLMVARYRYKAGEYADALAWLMSVQKKCSEDAYFHYLCAQCHAALGDEDTAKDSLKKVSAMSEDLKMRAVHDPVFDFIFG
jgi:predicted Zn-dependent protease